MTRRVEITVSEETWQRLEDLRGHEPRASFVKRALERALTVPPIDSLGPSPSPALLKAAAEQTKKVETALEARTASAAHREGKPLAADTAPRLGKGFVPPRPKGS